MFEKELTTKLKQIFQVDKVTLSAPGVSKEQKVLWVELERARVYPHPPTMHGRVEGRGYIFGRSEDVNFGTFARAIARAQPSITKDFIFTELETSTNIVNDIVQRGFSFVYFFRGQYDPNVAKISDITVTVEGT